MPLRIGDTFAGYRVLRLLGSGGMGEVYLVQHPRLPRQDALKVLRPDISSDSSFRERFIREADLAAGLRHPHIIGIHDRGDHDGRLWISMDFVDGTDLAHQVAPHYPAGMPVDLVATITTSVASALDYAHKKGLLHRDVKPANIIVADLDSDDRQIFLADFGIARPIDDISGITTTNMTVGTVAYAAPEQLLGEEMDGRVDQYALAATAYHLLTGLQLFPHSNPAVVISRHLHTTPPTMGDRRPDLAGLDAVLAIALAKDPADRFPSCSAFAQALLDESPGLGAASAGATTQAASKPRKFAPTTSFRRSSTQLPATSTRRSWMIFGSILAAIVLLGAAALVWRPGENEDSNVAGTTSSTAISSTSAPAPTDNTTTTITTATTPPGAVRPSAVDSLTLTPAEINAATDGLFSGLYGGDMVVKNSSYGMVDNSAQVRPPECVGVIFGNDHSVYGDSGVEEIRDQTLAPSNYTSDKTVEQSIAVFPDQASAQASAASQIRQWHNCYRHTDADIPPSAAGTMQVGQRYSEGGITWTLGDVSDDEAAPALPMVGYDNESGYHGGCQVALGSKSNVVVWVRACQTVDSPPVLTDLSYAKGTYAQRLVAAIVDKVAA
ncbi:serine/threonine-protein kinase PknH/PknJ [Mycobacterium sp. 2YAF39]|uniref:serine/threonine-protein kinase PknH/PknJ n=1 Tax=Mycobacterium sp. 2YAF39 TaxID=3233033 RepID=UPI003F9D3C37